MTKHIYIKIGQKVQNCIKNVFKVLFIVKAIRSLVGK